MLSVLHDCQTLQLKRLHFRCDLAYNYTTITLFAAFSIVCLDLCGKAQRWWRGTTWPNKQGTSGNTVSPELCAHGAYVRGSTRSDALQMTLKMRFYKCSSVKCIHFESLLCLWEKLTIFVTRMVLNVFYSCAPSAVRTLPERVCFAWEAETGPPLTSVGLVGFLQ